MTDKKQHWEEVYKNRPVDRLGWYKPHIHRSVEWIKELVPDWSDPVIDVGGGVSTLADDLLAEEYMDITVVDISGKALSHARERLRDKADRITWIEGDILQTELPEKYYTLWHDRAVFHFLTDENDQEAYIERMKMSLKAGGFVIMATFAPEAPPKCSGLPVERYDVYKLVTRLGSGFRLLGSVKEMHVTPGGVEQMYLYSKFRMV